MSNNAPVIIPYKSTAVALIFSALLGPIGLLYASFWGGFVMTILGFVVLISQLIYPIILIWMISCVWSVGAVESYNKHIYNAYLQK